MDIGILRIHSKIELTCLFVFPMQTMTDLIMDFIFSYKKCEFSYQTNRLIV